MSNSSSVLYWHNFRRAKLSSSLTSFSSSVQTAYSAFLNVDAFSMLAKTPPPPMWTPTHPPLYPPCTLDDSPGDQLDPISSQWRWATKNQSPQYPAGVMVRKRGLERGEGGVCVWERQGLTGYRSHFHKHTRPSVAANGLFNLYLLSTTMCQVKPKMIWI